MEKRGKVHLSLIIALVVVALAIIGLVIYSSTRGPSTADINAAHCKLKSNFPSITLSQGVSSGLSLSGYQGTLNQVFWKSENPNVAVVNPISGPDSMVQAKSPGTTHIIATDHAVSNDCTVSVEVTVK